MNSLFLKPSKTGANFSGPTDGIYIYIENIFQFFLEEKQNIFLKHWGICDRIFPFYSHSIVTRTGKFTTQKKKVMGCLISEYIWDYLH
jgi:hypothetical protein